MTKLEMMQQSQGLTDLFTGLETDLINNIAAYLARGDADISTAQWKMRMLAQLGALDRANIKTIAEYAGLTPEMLADALESSALSAIEELEPGFQKLARDGVIRGTEVPVEKTMERAVKTYRRQAQKDLNLVNTVMRYKAKDAAQRVINGTAELAEKQTFLDMLNKAAGKTVTGIESRQAAMRQCIKEMSEKGIPAFVDKCGREWSPEAYINMDIRTTANNVAHQAQFDRMDDYGIDLVEVSSHSGARPKCAKDQGKIFNRSGDSGTTTDLHGKSIRYYAWKSSSYGEPDGILGINCGHQIYPFIPGVSYQTYFPEPEKENDALYRKTQKQRELERRVRASKRECTALSTVGDTEGLKEASVTLKQRQQALKGYCSDAGLSYKSDRTAVVGYNKSVSAKVSASAKKSSAAGLTNDGGSGIITMDDVNHGFARETIESAIESENPIFARDGFSKLAKDYLRSEKGYEKVYTVVAHGSPESIQLFGAEEIDAEVLAYIIRQRGDYHGGVIRLLSCSTGYPDGDGNCFAQDLADIMGAEIIAPNNTVWLIERPNRIDITVGKTPHDDSGNFNTIKPRWQK